MKTCFIPFSIPAVPVMKRSERVFSTASCVALCYRFSHLRFTFCATRQLSCFLRCGLSSLRKFGVERGDWGRVVGVLCKTSRTSISISWSRVWVGSGLALSICAGPFALLRGTERLTVLQNTFRIAGRWDGCGIRVNSRWVEHCLNRYGTLRHW